MHPLLNRFGSKIFWNRTDIQLTNKEQFLRRYMLFETLEQMLVSIFSINNYFHSFLRLWMRLLGLANSRVLFQQFVDERRAARRERRTAEPVPYRRYYEIFSRVVFKRLGFYKVTEDPKASLAAGTSREEGKPDAPFYVPGEMRLQEVVINVMGFAQKILVVDLNVLRFPIYIRYIMPDEARRAAHAKWQQIQYLKNKNRPAYGRMEGNLRIRNEPQMWQFYERIFKKHFMHVTMNFRIRNRGFRARLKTTKGPLRFKVKRHGYRLRKMYRTLDRFLKHRVRRQYRRFKKKLAKLRQRISFFLKMRKYTFMYFFEQSIIGLFASKLHEEGLTKVKINVNFLREFTDFTAQTLAEYLLDKFSKGYGLEQVFKYTKQCLEWIFRRRRISGYRICFAGRFTKRQIATFRWEKSGRTGINTKPEIMDYGHGVAVGKYGMYTLRIWMNLWNLDERRFEGRK